MNSNEKSILTTTCFGHFLSHFNMLFFPALVIPLTTLYSLELPAVIALSFWMYVLFGLTALPWGLLSDKFGAKTFLLLFYAGAGFSALAAGLFLESPALFSLSLAGVGLFSGIYHPAGLGLISKGITEKMSLALGYNGMAGNLGLALAPIMAGVINYFSGPEMAFYVLGGLNLVGAAVMLMLPIAEAGNGSNPKPSPYHGILAGFIVLCLCIILQGLTYRGTSVILPTYFELRNEGLYQYLTELQGILGSKNVAATALTSLVYFIGIFGQFIGGWTAQKFDPRKGYLLFHSLSLPMVLLMAYTTDIPLILVSMVYLLFLLGMQPIENTLIAQLSPEKLRHSAYGAKFILSFGVGALAVYLVGWVEQIWSLPAVFIAMTLATLILVLCIFVLFAVTRNRP
ncbi:MAG: MFS transporter [Desulfohalobiaceae bacterium]|nr:MFS transporter [Desulfohalobiaceae bacterium]